jgi:hypothetical protein
MSQDQVTISLILLVTIGGFLLGRFRRDVVAVIALMGCVLTGLVGALRLTRQQLMPPASDRQLERDRLVLKRGIPKRPWM